MNKIKNVTLTHLINLEIYDPQLVPSVLAEFADNGAEYMALSNHTLKKLKEEGRIKHIAMSFHDTADVLDTVLSEQPDIEAVQLQINYLDFDDPGIQSKA